MPPVLHATKQQEACLHASQVHSISVAPWVLSYTPSRKHPGAKQGGCVGCAARWSLSDPGAAGGLPGLPSAVLSWMSIHRFTKSVPQEGLLVLQ